MSNYDKPGSLDGAIDEAVREMMQVDARPGLRNRVARSISAPRQRTYGFRLGFVAVALAVVVLASLLILRPSGPAGPVPAPQAAESTPAVPATPMAGPQAVEPPAVAATAPAGATRPRRRTLPTPESIFGPRRDKVAATSIPTRSLETPVADPWLEFAAGAAGRVALTPITLAPIQIAPLAIQPLFIGGLAPRK